MPDDELEATPSTPESKPIPTPAPDPAAEPEDPMAAAGEQDKKEQEDEQEQAQENAAKGPEKNPLLKKVLSAGRGEEKHETGLDEMQNLANQIQDNAANMGDIRDLFKGSGPQLSALSDTAKDPKAEAGSPPESPEAAEAGEGAGAAPELNAEEEAANLPAPPGA